ncbi:hypothetical protein EVAR_44780_1 [Eumeta japonica]|uniref:Uncharacterized protein n=1 Tax=Eumeta variegata TaxID=151549 RepID=A0A4C1Y7V1_EUMVA|nr:hypothetical protein EVAR_44780_1 [Eumeta japonica]
MHTQTTIGLEFIYGYPNTLLPTASGVTRGGRRWRPASGATHLEGVTSNPPRVTPRLATPLPTALPSTAFRVKFCMHVLLPAINSESWEGDADPVNLTLLSARAEMWQNSCTNLAAEARPGGDSSLRTAANIPLGNKGSQSDNRETNIAVSDGAHRGVHGKPFIVVNQTLHLARKNISSEKSTVTVLSSSREFHGRAKLPTPVPGSQTRANVVIKLCPHPFPLLLPHSPQSLAPGAPP